jgi:hypothetical protein
MRNVVVFLRLAAPVVLTAVTFDIAPAASPAYCALYAREYAISRIGPEGTGSAAPALQRVQDQAYYRCLNQDEDPEFPTTSAYFGAAVEDITGETADVGGPFQDVGEGDASAGDETPVEPAPVVKPKPKPKKLASKGSGKGSGLTPWSDEWVTWCKSNYRSFNATTGFVLTLSGERKLCP